MKEERMNNLIEKYKSASTSLEEEKMLFESNVIEEEPIRNLSTFINKNRKQVPENFNEKLWESFEEKTKTINNFKIGLLVAAASIALLVSLFINNNQNELTFSEKEALLNEAKSMFVASNETKEKYAIVLENELVVVYTKSE